MSNFFDFFLLIEHDTFLSIGVKKSNTITMMQIETNPKLSFPTLKNVNIFFLVPQLWLDLPTYLKFWHIVWLMFKRLKMHWMHGIWIKLIMLWTFQDFKNCNYFKD